MASAAGYCSLENPAWLMYAASGNVAVCLMPDTDLSLKAKAEFSIALNHKTHL